jgi:hypothetical protein
MARGHSARHGRSRCCAKPGPSSRAHKRRSLRLDGDRKDKGGRSLSDPLDSMVSEARPDSRRSS